MLLDLQRRLRKYKTLWPQTILSAVTVICMGGLITTTALNASVAAAERPENDAVVAFKLEKTHLDSRDALTVTAEEKELLARAVFSEARGEVFDGQVAVAAVILNRMEHPDFPHDVSGVIFQPQAFSAVDDGQFWLEPDQQAYRAVETALKGSDPSRGAIYYYNPVKATSYWIFGRPIITRIGRHVFAS